MRVLEGHNTATQEILDDGENQIPSGNSCWTQVWRKLPAMRTREQGRSREAHLGRIWGSLPHLAEGVEWVGGRVPRRFLSL